MTFRFARPLAIVFAGLFLASCSDNPFQITRSNCPAVAVAGNTGTWTGFASDERLQGDVTYQAVITTVRVDCVESSTVDSTLSFRIRAEKGPAAVADSVTIPYFVLTLKDNSQIITKKVFETTVTFAPGQMSATVQEVINHHLPDIERARRYDYEILIGFQLDPNDVVFNVLRLGT